MSNFLAILFRMSKDRLTLVRIALCRVLASIAQWSPDSRAPILAIARKNLLVKQTSVRYEYGKLVGMIVARAVPADAEGARKEAQRKVAEKSMHFLHI